MKSWVRIVLEDTLFGQDWPEEPIGSGLKRIIELVEGSQLHPFRTARLEEFAEDISQAEDLNQLADLMLQTAHEAGFQHYTIFVITQGRDGPFRTRVSTSYRADWVNRYQEKNYQHVDPVVARAAQEDGCFLFSDLEDRSPVVQSFWDDAEAHKVGRNGWCNVMTRTDGSRLGVSFSTARTTEQTREIARLNGFDLEFITQLAIDGFCFLTSNASRPETELTVEELRFLFTLATNSNPKVATEITSGFGSNAALQASIRKKLGVASAYQAVAFATSNGLFDQLPYMPEEVAKPFPALAALDNP